MKRPILATHEAIDLLIQNPFIQFQTWKCTVRVQLLIYYPLGQTQLTLKFIKYTKLRYKIYLN